MTNSQLIATRTNELAASLGIEDQLQGLTTAQKLANMAVRFNRLSSVAAKAAAAKCLAMQAVAERLNAQ
jgi:hypothetical protein